MDKYVLTERDGALLIVPASCADDLTCAVATFEYPQSEVAEAIRTLRAVNLAFKTGFNKGVETYAGEL